MKTTPLVAIMALALAGSVEATATAPIPPLTYARLGQTISLGGYAITPRAVLEDSRCPAMVTCVWSGQVRLSLRIVSRRSGERFTGEMTSMRPLQLRRGALHLMQVEPPNQTNGRRIRPGEYRFGFRLSGG